MFDAFQILQGTGVIRASEKVENLIVIRLEIGALAAWTPAK
jgi:hypothetical protein